MQGHYDLVEDLWSKGALKDREEGGVELVFNEEEQAQL